MKRVFAFVFAALAVLFLQAPFSGAVEAARVVIAPIEINDDKVARSSDFNNYYWDIMIDKFRFPEYDLIDEAKSEAVIPLDGLKTFDQKTLETICDQSDAEIVVAMRLDDVHGKVVRSRREPKTRCYMKGLFAGYNRLTGKYYFKKINYYHEIETPLTLKNDWQQEAFTSTLKRCLNQMLEGKGKEK
jgi:hypothetical protein